MAVRFVSVPFAFAGAGEVVLRTHPAEASDSVLVGLSFVNELGSPNDRTVLARHKASSVYSGGYQEVVPGGEANKDFTPGCLSTSTPGHQIVATLNGSGSFRGVAVFRETYTP